MLSMAPSLPKHQLLESAVCELKKQDARIASLSQQLGLQDPSYEHDMDSDKESESELEEEAEEGGGREENEEEREEKGRRRRGRSMRRGSEEENEKERKQEAESECVRTSRSRSICARAHAHAHAIMPSGSFITHTTRQVRLSEGALCLIRSPIAIHVVSLTPDHTVLDVNEYQCMLMGYEREEMVGQAAHTFVSANTLRKGGASIMSLVGRGGDCLTVEGERVCKSGKVLRYQGVGVLLKRDNKPFAYLSISRVI